MPLFYTPDLCHLTRARGVEFPVNPSLLSPPFSPNPHSSNSSTPPIAAAAAPAQQQPNNPSTPTHHGLPATTNPSNNTTTTASNNGCSPLSIPVREASHVYHESYMYDIASRSDLELSALTGTFHWRGLDLLRRSIAFHKGLLKSDDGAAAVGEEAERKKKRKMKHALESSKEKALLFVGGEGDLVDRHGASVT